MKAKGYCVDCKWYVRRGSTHFCGHSHIAEIDVVTGKRELVCCKDARSRDGKCGPLGDRFMPKITGVKI